MKFYKISLLAGLISLSLNLHAKEYEYNANCRHFNHVGLFEQCLDKELAFYDGKLNGLYLSFGANKALEQSELLWIKFKETDCRYMARTANNSLRSRLVYKACVLEKTKNRIADLKKSNSYIEWFRTV
jgi:uncharacterized protein YecT (DUF1311 family)